MTFVLDLLDRDELRLQRDVPTLFGVKSTENSA
jgi:hypothetical protein